MGSMTRRAGRGMAVAGLAIGTQGLPRTTRYQPVRRLFPRLEGRGSSDHVALTFDDGPDPSSTPAFLEVLASLEVRATFFVLGEMVQRAGGLTRELAERGHELAVHGWDHGAYFVREPLRVRRDLAHTRALMQELAGVSPSFYRPPYEKLTGSALLAARSLGLRTVLWSAWGKDWSDAATATSVLQTLWPDLDGGATILLHDSDSNSASGSWRATLEAIGPLVNELRSRGLRIGTLSEHGHGVGWR
jgi:peptidoglycan-N-acetylglucosamine deacetylase